MAGKVANAPKVMPAPKVTPPAASAALALDPVIHERARLAILTALGSQGELTFTELRDLIGATDGNLATHAAKLEAAGLIASGKGMLGTRVKTTYSITTLGQKRLMDYLESLERLMGEVRGG